MFWVPDYSDPDWIRIQLGKRLRQAIVSTRYFMFEEPKRPLQGLKKTYRIFLDKKNIFTVIVHFFKFCIKILVWIWIPQTTWIWIQWIPGTDLKHWFYTYNTGTVLDKAFSRGGSVSRRRNKKLYGAKRRNIPRPREVFLNPDPRLVQCMPYNNCLITVDHLYLL